MGQHRSALLANPDQQLTRAAMAPLLQQLWAELPAFVAEQALASLPSRHLSWLWAGQSAGARGSEHQRQRCQIGASTVTVTCWAAHPAFASCRLWHAVHTAAAQHEPIPMSSTLPDSSMLLHACCHSATGCPCLCRHYAKFSEPAAGSGCWWPLSRPSRATAPHADTGKGFNLLHNSPAAEGPAPQCHAQRCLLPAGPDMAECVQQVRHPQQAAPCCHPCQCMMAAILALQRQLMLTYLHF